MTTAKHSQWLVGTWHLYPKSSLIKIWKKRLQQELVACIIYILYHLLKTSIPLVQDLNRLSLIHKTSLIAQHKCSYPQYSCNQSFLPFNSILQSFLENEKRKTISPTMSLSCWTIDNKTDKCTLSFSSIMKTFILPTEFKVCILVWIQYFNPIM